MSSSVELISEVDFHDSWGVITKESGDLFQYSEVSSHAPNLVWTIVESGCHDDENWYAIPGIHHVNRLGFVLTQREWMDASVQAIYFENDMQCDDEVQES
jgi:hypothetical protein